jgi:uncharacterized membrane protein
MKAPPKSVTPDVTTSAEAAALTAVRSAESSSAMPLKKSSRRIAAIDWVRGVAMLLMVLDHVSLAYHRNHISNN